MKLNRTKVYRLLLVTALLMGGSVCLKAQEPEWLWGKGAGGVQSDRSFSIAVDGNGNIYLTGIFKGFAFFGNTELQSAGRSDAFVAKMDNEGNWLWAQRAGGTLDCIGSSIAIDDEGNIYLSGSFDGTALFGEIELISSGGLRRNDVFVAKLDNNGNWLWASRAGGEQTSHSGDIGIDSNGDIYISGIFAGTVHFGETELRSSGESDIFVAKLDNDGNWLWARRAGGRAWCSGIAISVDSDGNSFVTGIIQDLAYFGDTVLRSAGRYDMFVAKLDSDGNWLWARRAGGTEDCRGTGVAVDSEGNCYVVGSFRGTADFGETELHTAGCLNPFVAKLDSFGNWLWAISPESIYDCSGQGVAIDGENNIFTTGSFAETITFGATELHGEEISAYVVKLDSFGNWLWAAKVGGPSWSWGSDIVADSTGNSYVTGDFTGTVNFGEHQIHSQGGTSIYAAKITSNPYSYPDNAGNSFPINDGTNVSVGLDTLRWEYISNLSHVDPNGFRVYFNDTGEFDEDDEFDWVPYFEEQEGYSTSEVLPEHLTYSTKYFWKVVPTTKENGLGEGEDARDCSVWTFVTELFPYPLPGVNPYPADDSVGVAVGLENLRWGYVVDSTTVNPVGFRVFFNDTGEFDEDDEFDWVPYIEEQEGYSTSEVLPERLAYSTEYFWKVVPTTRADGIGEGEDAQIVPLWAFLTEIGTSLDIQKPSLLTELRTNYPNPFNPQTVIEFSIKQSTHTAVSIYNTRGQLVKTLHNSIIQSGEHRLIWNGKDEQGINVSSGVYLYRLKTDDYDQMRMMLLIK